LDLKPKIYDSLGSNNFALDSLLDIYKDLGGLIYKLLSPNDNSKNQPYMGGHINDLGFLPTGDIVESLSLSNKTKDPKRKVKFTASLKYFWLSSDGHCYSAPNAKLIYYPQYPEVRLSGFLHQCNIDIGGWMDPDKKGRSNGRVLFLGVKEDCFPCFFAVVLVTKRNAFVTC